MCRVAHAWLSGMRPRNGTSVKHHDVCELRGCRWYSSEKPRSRALLAKHTRRSLREEWRRRRRTSVCWYQTNECSPFWFCKIWRYRKTTVGLLFATRVIWFSFDYSNDFAKDARSKKRARLPIYGYPLCFNYTIVNEFSTIFKHIP